MTILLVAGETSGDLHGAALARELRRLRPQCRLVGVGGERMAAEGVEILVPMEEIAVLGFAEVVRRYPALHRAMKRLRSFLRDERPDVFVPIDYPGMNLRLAGASHRAGVPVVYYVSPQLWAWGKWRLGAIRRTVKRMVVILPFEEEFYREAGIEVRFVGHPLLDAPPPSLAAAPYRRRLGVAENAPLVALLPGSRAQEVERIFPPMAEAARELARTRPGTRFVAAGASAARSDELERLVRRSAAPVLVVTGETRELLNAADLALVASGTATLESACMGVPMVVVYRMARLSWWIARRLVRVPHVAMANLIAGRRLVPELLQDEARGHRLAAEARALLDDPPRRAEIRAGLGEVRRALGEPGAAARAARVVLEEAGA